MYFSSGHMPEAVIPGMLCPVLVAVLGRSRGQSRTALLPTPWEPRASSHLTEKPGKGQREIASRQRIKAFGGFFSSSNLLWTILGAQSDLRLPTSPAVLALPLQECLWLTKRRWHRVLQHLVSLT